MSEISGSGTKRTAEDETLFPELKKDHEDHPDGTPEDAEQTKKKKGHPQSLGQRWGATSLPNKLSIIFSAAIFLATTAYAAFSGYQLSVMKDSGKQTDRIIAANERLAKAMEDSVTNQKDALAQTLAQNKAALNSSIAASRIDQRAWVGVKAMQLTSFAAGQPTTGEVLISNSGKTFALDAVVRVWIHPGEPTTTLPKPKPKEISPMVIFPNQETLISVSAPIFPQEADISAIKDKKAFIYLYGTIVYFDVFKQKHTSEFCGFSDGKKNFTACTFGNTAD